MLRYRPAANYHRCYIQADGWGSGDWDGQRGRVGAFDCKGERTMKSTMQRL